MRLTVGQRLLIVTTLAAILGAAAFGLADRSNQAQKAELSAKLASLATPTAALNATAQSPATSDPLLHTPAFPRDPPELGLASAVLRSAAASGVSSGPIQTTTGPPETIGSTTYRATIVQLTVRGTLPQVLGFFDRLEAAGLRTIVFDNMHLAAENGVWSAQLQIIVYAQPVHD